MIATKGITKSQGQMHRYLRLSTRAGRGTGIAGGHVGIKEFKHSLNFPTVIMWDRGNHVIAGRASEGEVGWPGVAVDHAVRGN